MMQKISRWAFVIALSFLSIHSASAQMKGWEVGGWAGVSNYFGDLNTNWRLTDLHLSGGGGARYNFNDRLAMRFGLNYGKISAADADSKNIYEQRRNLSFSSILLEGGAQFEFNFLPYVHGHRDYYFTPYMSLGATGYYFNPVTEYEGQTVRLANLGTEGQFRGEEYNTVQGAISYGMGLRYDLSYRWSFNMEFSARKLFTDYIDDVSGNYADVRDIRGQRGELAAALADRSVEPKIGLEGRQRGNGKNNDTFMLLNVGLMYYFGHIRCPQMMN